jgi:hypothetical protein
VKLLVLSDTHGDISAVPCAVEREKPDMIVHLGDCAGDALAIREKYPEIPLHAVNGNNDNCRAFFDEDILELCGNRIYITHGHLHRVKTGAGGLVKHGLSLGAGAVFYGHTHLPCITPHGGLTAFNPGSAWGRSGTYGVADVSESGIRCKIMNVKRQPLPRL